MTGFIISRELIAVGYLYPRLALIPHAGRPGRVSPSALGTRVALKPSSVYERPPVCKRFRRACLLPFSATLSLPPISLSPQRVPFRSVLARVPVAMTHDGTSATRAFHDVTMQFSCTEGYIQGPGNNASKPFSYVSRFSIIFIFIFSFCNLQRTWINHLELITSDQRSLSSPLEKN